MGILDNIANIGKSVIEQIQNPEEKKGSLTGMVLLEDGSKVNKKDLPYGSVYINEEGQKVYKLIKQPVAIESNAQMQQWLGQLETVAPPAISVALRCQMETLNAVFNASLAGMAIDNMLFGLQKSLQLTSDEAQRTNLRDNFCMMIQNFVFINEAKLLYASEENRMEAAQLLGQAGAKMMSCAVNMGMECIRTVQMGVVVLTAAMEGKAAARIMAKKITTSDVPPVVRNPFEGKEAEKMLGDLAKSLAKKKIYEEKQVEFDKMMNNLFPMFDRYYDIIGPSILVTGLLERYCNKITEKFEIRKYSGILSRITSFQPPRKFLVKTPPTDYDYVRALEIELNAEAVSAKKALQLKRNELEEYKSELKSKALNPFKSDRREELKKRISEQERAIKMQRDTAEIAETTRYKLEQILQPIKDEVASFRAGLMRVVDKYDVNKTK